MEDARHLAQRKKWPAAEKALKTILAQMPRHFSARSVLALVEFKRGHLDDAKAQYLELLAQDPKQFRLYGMLGQIAMLQDNLEESERYNREALNIAPQFVESMGQLGLLAMLRGDAETAQQWYDKALAIDPTFPTLHRRLGDVLFDRGDFAGALKEYQAAYARQSKDLRSLLQAAASARRMGDDALAEKLLHEAIEKKPASWIARYNLACLLAQRGNADTAFAALNDAIAHGMVYPNLIKGDEDWDGLRKDARFIAITARIAEMGKAATPKAGDEDPDIPDAD